MGLQTPPEAWGGHVLTMAEVDVVTNYVMVNGADGLMLWSLQKRGSPSPQQVSTRACQLLQLAPNCSQPLLG